MAEAHAKLKGRRPNLRTGEGVLDELDEQGVDVTEAHSALEEYEATTREDFDPGKAGSADYKKAREEAWKAFLEALESTKEPEAEEE